jgi:hypothetical protein
MFSHQRSDSRVMRHDTERGALSISPLAQFYSRVSRQLQSTQPAHSSSILALLDIFSDIVVAAVNAYSRI